MEKYTPIKKRKITETILRFQSKNVIRVGELYARLNENQLTLKDDDILEIGYNEGYYSENNSWDPHYFCELSRVRIESDEAFEQRKADIKISQSLNKDRRYKQYLKLKKEFDEQE